jgi:hypothetical protein
MKLDDYVWFNMKDDICIGPNYADAESTLRAGKIMKEGPLYPISNKIFWVTSLPVGSGALPLWAIPEHLVKPMKAEEVVLAILENS